MSDRPSCKCLIVSGNISIGYQIASLLQKLEWMSDVVHNDFKARDAILSEQYDVVVADIDSVDLGGLAILAFCHHRYPAVITYAIAQSNDEYAKKEGRDVGGCKGYFYLVNGKMELDLRRGMAAQLLAGISPIAGV